MIYYWMKGVSVVIEKRVTDLKPGDEMWYENGWEEVEGIEESRVTVFSTFVHTRFNGSCEFNNNQLFLVILDKSQYRDLKINDILK